MLKYILKRLGLSLIVLLGVSVIIYILVRLMPTNYVDDKFSSELQQGTITHEQIDEFKKRYGLFVPEAFIDIEWQVSGEYEGSKFFKDINERKILDLEDGKITYAGYYAGTYECRKSNNIFLEIGDDGVYKIIQKIKDEESIISQGRFTADENGIKVGDNYIPTIYREATAWNKFVAILNGYFSWLGNMLKGDLGDSFLYQRPVGEVISDHMWVSFLISLVALIFQFAIAIPLGIVSATRQYSVTDYAVTIITMIGISLPSFFFAALLIKVFSSWLGWFPASGLVSAGGSSEGIAYFFDMLHHLALPMMVLIVLSIGGLMRYTRTNMLEVLNSDYIRTARSKGLSEKKVIYVHAFRNTMIPLMTLLAGILPSLFGGAMITEEVFAIDGIGRLAYNALQRGDVPFIMGYNMFLAILTVIGTLLSDLMYAVVDPRVKLSK